MHSISEIRELLLYLSVAVPQPEHSAGDQTSGFPLRRREFTDVSCAPIPDGKINPINTVAVCQELKCSRWIAKDIVANSSRPEFDEFGRGQ